MKKVSAKSCLSCGLCCLPFHYQEYFCDVTKADVKRLGSERAVVFSDLSIGLVGSTPYGALKTKTKTLKFKNKKKKVCGCFYLRGTVFQDVRCSVYPNRPQVCRQVIKPGDKTCLKIRRFWQEYYSIDVGGSDVNLSLS